MVTQTDCHDILIRRLGGRHSLDEVDQVALRALPFILRTIEPGQYMMREGEIPTRCAFILNGFAYRHKLAANGGRMIVGIVMPGEFTDLQQILLRESDHNVQSLTRIEAADIALVELRKLANTRPNIGRAMWIDALIEGSIMRESLLNVGRRDGITRVAHILCEFAVRLHASGNGTTAYEMPMTQEQIGDATGLTSVHVNRALRQLEREGLIERHRRVVRILDRRGMEVRADFSSRYLHLDQIAPPEPA